MFSSLSSLFFRAGVYLTVLADIAGRNMDEKAAVPLLTDIPVRSNALSVS